MNNDADAERGPRVPPPESPPMVHALAYAHRGWRVAWAPRGEKRPVIKGWQDKATTDVATIIAWYSANPDANICIATGEESGFFALDVDDAPGKRGSKSLAELEDKYDALPETYVVATGSGGCHFYFSWQGVDFDLRNSAGKLGEDLDTRGNGGQVVAPPSVADDPTHFQAYSVMSDAPVAAAPRWLLELLRPKPAVLPQQRQASRAVDAEFRQPAAVLPTGKVADGKGTAYGLAALARVCESLRMCPDGMGDHTIYHESLGMGQLLAGGELTDPEYVIAELRAAISTWHWRRAGDDVHAWHKIERCVREGMRREPRNAPERPFRRSHGHGSGITTTY